jgi:cytochrome c oxidase subunit 2
LADALLGQPTPGGIGMQPTASPVAHGAAWFHNALLMPVITIITLFVLGLLIYVMVRFNKRANPVPARFTHNTTVEIVWTVAPVIILLVIAVFSYKLLFAFNDTPRADLTLKVTGYQWYWGFELPDQGVPEITSVMLPEEEAVRQNRPFRLAVDKPIVVPQGAVVKVLVTGGDVMHSFGIPAFGFTTDAIPGRVNQTWFKAERTGVYYGQCRELCGVDHAFMPFEIRVVTPAEFAQWVVANGGQMGGRAATAASEPAPPPGAAAPAPTTAPQPAVAAAAQGAGATPPPTPGAATGSGVAGAPPAAQTGPAGSAAAAPSAPNAASGAAGAAPAPAAQSR